MNPNDPQGGKGSTNYDSGIRLLNGGDSILLEDCVFSYCELVVQGSSGNMFTNVTIRRNVFKDVYAHGSTTSNAKRPSGFFLTHIDGLLIEENTLDHNGYSDAFEDSKANMYNHNMYIQQGNIDPDKLIVRGNIVSRGSSQGIMCRPGGLIEDNFIIQNGVGIGYKSKPWVSRNWAIIRNNVVTEGRPDVEGDFTDPQSSAIWGIYLSDDVRNGKSVLVQNNIVANPLTTRGGVVGIRNYNNSKVTYDNNIVYKWPGGIKNETDGSKFKDPNRSAASYMKSLGLTATFDAFINVVRNRQLGTWDDRFSAYAINAYIRDGFSLKGSNSSPSPKPTPTIKPTDSPTNMPKLSTPKVSTITDKSKKIKGSVPKGSTSRTVF